MATEKPKRKLQIRMLIVFVSFALILGLLGVRLFFLQVVQGPELQREAVEQQTRDNEVASKRGTIYDRNRKTLAQSSTVETVTANPNEIRKAKKDAAKIAAELGAVLDMDAAEIQKLLDKETNHVTIKRKIDVELATKVREFGSDRRVFAGGREAVLPIRQLRLPCHRLHRHGQSGACRDRNGIR